MVVERYFAINIFKRNQCSMPGDCGKLASAGRCRISWPELEGDVYLVWMIRRNQCPALEIYGFLALISMADGNTYDVV